MLSFDNYFKGLKSYDFNEIFDNVRYPWTPIKNLEKFIKKYLRENKNHLGELEGLKCFKIKNRSHKEEKIINVEKPVRVKKNTLIKGMDIFISKGTFIEPGAIIKGPAIIGKNSEIRQGAYIRGNVICGQNCVIGHTTEIKNSILLNHVEAGHFAYIGDSILGDFVNLGAGTKIANLQLRSNLEKKTGKIKDILVSFEGKSYNTKMCKLGAIIGDGAEIGCNTVTSPGTFISKNTWIYPNTTVQKGFYTKNSIIRNANRGLDITSSK